MLNNNRNGDIVIGVMGGIWNGGATFLNLFNPQNRGVTDPAAFDVTGEDFTFSLDGRSVRVISVDGFDNIQNSEMEIYDQVQAFCQRNNIDRIHWVLCFHSMTSNYPRAILERSQWHSTFRSLTDKNNLSNVFICTCEWESVSGTDGNTLAAELERGLGDALYNGARLEHMRSGADQNYEAAVEFLITVLRSDPGPVAARPRPAPGPSGRESPDEGGSAPMHSTRGSQSKPKPRRR